MIGRLNIMIIVFSLNYKLCYSACARAEYEIDGECCPMCAPGNRVYKHCTEFTSTTCIPCSNSSYTSEPNGLISCLPCTVCDPAQSLRKKTACTQSSNTVCEPLEGYYCTDYKTTSCVQAKEHSKCSPGQYIQQKGTADGDTVCAECADGSFSNGSLQTCWTHSQCEDLGLTEIKPGSNSSDAECGNKSSRVTFAVIIGFAVTGAVAGIAATMYFIKKRHSPSEADPAPPSAQQLIPRSVEDSTPTVETHMGPEIRAAVDADGSDASQFENDQLQHISENNPDIR